MESWTSMDRYYADIQNAKINVKNLKKFKPKLKNQFQKHKF